MWLIVFSHKIGFGFGNANGSGEETKVFLKCVSVMDGSMDYRVVVSVDTRVHVGV